MAPYTAEDRERWRAEILEARQTLAMMSAMFPQSVADELKDEDQ